MRWGLPYLRPSWIALFRGSERQVRFPPPPLRDYRKSGGADVGGGLRREPITGP